MADATLNEAFREKAGGDEAASRAQSWGYSRVRGREGTRWARITRDCFFTFITSARVELFRTNATGNGCGDMCMKMYGRSLTTCLTVSVCLLQAAQLMKEDGIKGVPASPEALRAYGQRMLRPGEIQGFGVVMLLGTKESAKLTGAKPGTVLAVSENSEKLIGIKAEELLVWTGSPPFSSRNTTALCPAREDDGSHHVGDAQNMCCD